MGVIYKIQHKESGKIYIGQTRRTLEQRMYEHLYNNNTYIDKSLTKYGRDAFYITIIETVDNEILNEREEYWIKFYDCIAPKGYNLNSGGNYAVNCEIVMEENFWKPIVCIETKQYFKSINDASEKTGYRHTNISRAAKGTRKTLYGLHWRYATEEEIKQEKVLDFTIQEHKKEKYNKNCKPIVCNENNRFFYSQKQASEELEINEQNISRVLLGQRKKTHGLTFRYATEQEILLHKKGA